VKFIACLLGAISAASAFAQGDPTQLAKIVDEGKNHSQVVSLLHELAFDIGPRVTGSPELAKAQRWAMGHFKHWGLKNVHLEKWGDIPVGFERGRREVGRMILPTQADFSFTTNNWTEGTHGLKRGYVYREPKTLDEAKALVPKLKNSWILCQNDIGMRGAAVKEADDIRKVLDDAGISGRIFGTTGIYVWSHGNFKDKTYEKHPMDVEVTITRADYQKLADAIDKGTPAEVEFNLDNRWIRGPLPQYNVVAEIPGTDKPDEIVIVSGHLDSWNSPGSQGANDNGTGSCVALETARILAATHAKPKRTIRFILWSGEEEGLLGSKAYVDAHTADLDKISAVLVDDGGSNYHSGFTAYDVDRPMLEEAFAATNAAFPDMQLKFRETKDMTKANGSDHAPFDWKGIPGLDVGQAGKQRYVRVWHTQFDRFEEAVPEYLVQGATDFAIVSYNLACADTMLPRVALTKKE
jgi:carboxypeptidase Q